MAAYFDTFNPGAPLPQDPRLPDGRVVALWTGGGNPNLTEETADTWSVGFTFTPPSVPSLTLAVSYYDIVYEDKIGNANGFLAFFFNQQEFADSVDRSPDPALVAELLDPQGKVFLRNGLPFFNSLDLFNPALADISIEEAIDLVQLVIEGRFANLSSQEARGLDFSVSYSLDTDVGTFGTSLNATYAMDFIQQLTSKSMAVDQVDLIYRPQDLNFNGSLSWSRGGFSSALSFFYTDSFINDQLPGRTQEVGSFTSYDLSLSYNTGEGNRNRILNDISLNLVVNNVFNKQPVFVDTEVFSFDFRHFDPTRSASVVQGRFASLSLVKRF